MANYSFVQLYTEDCQTVIDKLNGYNYRGRSLAVSFSRQKSDAEGSEIAGEEDVASQTDYEETAAQAGQAPVDEAPQMSEEDAAAYAAAEKAAADKEPFGNI